MKPKIFNDITFSVHFVEYHCPHLGWPLTEIIGRSQSIKVLFMSFGWGLAILVLSPSQLFLSLSYTTPLFIGRCPGIILEQYICVANIRKRNAERLHD